MPVGTLGAVKGLSVDALSGLGAQLMLANLYHLSLRPGIDVIDRLGGIHAFTGWSGPILTDSGGFQIWSLASLRKVDDGGVTFRSHLDGDELRFTPESVVAAQHRMGVDIAMVLDECPPWPISEADAEISLARTSRWAETARRAWEETPESVSGLRAGGLFGIVQGSVYPRLRARAVEVLTGLDFAGYAVGGVSVGEEMVHRHAVVEMTAPLLPAERPRYLMGLGTPQDILHAVTWGIDLFDCVLPARNARHGTLFTDQGVIKIKNARYLDDPRPVGPPGSPLAGTSRAFLHHLFRTKEITGPVLATLHNLHHYLDFMRRLREGIKLGKLSELAGAMASRYADGETGGASA